MNIAVIGKFNIEGSGLHIKEALENMGHTVICIDPEVKFMQFGFIGYRGRSMARTFYQQFLGKIPFFRKLKANSIYNYYHHNKIDLSIVLHDYFSTQEITAIKKINPAPIALWFPDAISNFKKSMFFVAGYDYLFFVDHYIVKKLKEEFLLNTHFLPQCYNPAYHKIEPLTKNDQEFYGCEITNVGNLYPSRIALYKHLTKYNFKMWGAKPAFWLTVPEIKKIITGTVVFQKEKAKAFGAAKIVLNNLHPAVINGINKRAFEIAGCGGFQIITHSDAVSQLFTVGKEIVTYSNYSDLIKKLDYYLDPKNEGERKQIAEAGHQRAMKEHTYEHRLKTILHICKSQLNES
ncbi:glycosyltransferase [Vicingus serpentipes]|uniref:Glycosyltransferase n=1 Tax=Vicingus serpentipes TaxID=1926625 RepID=A0A5C6RP46_9FLAO|nr:glycosyltransferase [Vicingus serpentipes]TXB63705.1 glycosyltransferase [Vicingus serpentipes]